MSNIEDFGAERYTYVRGESTRFQTGLVRTVLPCDSETNERFETRMDLMCRQLLGMYGVASVSIEFERSEGALVKATVSVVECPREVPIRPDHRPAGGRRFDGARGARGGRASAQVIQFR
jgi:hypothetical protein